MYDVVIWRFRSIWPSILQNRSTLKRANSFWPPQHQYSHQLQVSSERLSGYSLDMQHSKKRHWKRVDAIAGATKYTYCTAKCLGGIYFRKKGDYVNFILCIQLHQGREDGFLDWSSTKELKLSVIPLETWQEGYLKRTGRSSEAEKKYYSRPIDGGNTQVSFHKTMLEWSYRERSGYIERDQLMPRFWLFGDGN